MATPDEHARQFGGLSNAIDSAAVADFHDGGNRFNLLVESLANDALEQLEQFDNGADSGSAGK